MVRVIQSLSGVIQLKLEKLKGIFLNKTPPLFLVVNYKNTPPVLLTC